MRSRTDALLGAVVLGSIGLVGLGLHLGLPTPSCALKNWTGLPCATCGTTRLLRAVASGDLLGALSLNPLVFCALAAVTTWSALSIMRLVVDVPAWRLVLEPADRGRLVLGLAAAVVLNWLYLLWRGV
jgi:uncharacterized protein DUF2752